MKHFILALIFAMSFAFINAQETKIELRGSGMTIQTNVFYTPEDLVDQLIPAKESCKTELTDGEGNSVFIDVNYTKGLYTLSIKNSWDTDSRGDSYQFTTVKETRLEIEKYMKEFFESA